MMKNKKPSLLSQTPQHKFKVGDKVRIKENLGNVYSSLMGLMGVIIERGDWGIHPVLGELKYRVQYVDIDIIVAENNLIRARNQIKRKVKLSSVVLPEHKKDEIKQALSQIKYTHKIFETWGFADVFEKGTAISLLFWGIPGTGKTLTAQAIADEVGAELKIYSTAEIETAEPGGAERNIQQIFADANRAEKEGKKRVILFDECDSLLMDRNEVGVIIGAQINCLLTQIEHYTGIIIFTTNRMGKLDPALERRITAKIEFEFPDKEARRAIWQRMIPKKAPINKDVDFDKLADYPVAGGNIKNAVLSAARMAAFQKAKQIHMSHFVEAVEREMKALQAFVAEYEKQNHQQMVGYQRTHGGISTGLQKTMKKTATVDSWGGEN